MAEVTNGIGLIQFAAGVEPEPYLPGQERIPPLQDPPTSSFERFRTAWRTAIQDEQLIAYVRSKLPSSLNQIPGYDAHAPFSPEATILSPFIYDAIMALGLSMCRAGSNTQFFTGTNIYDDFLTLTFDGASGHVVFDNVTGTRLYKTHDFILFNVRSYTPSAPGRAQFAIYPSLVYQDALWETVGSTAENEFIFADGTTVCPPSLPPVQENYNFIGSTGRAIGYSFMGLVQLGSIVAVIWLGWNRKERAIRSSQPLFLFMVATGAFIMATAILPLSGEETLIPNNLKGLDRCCMAVPWLYLVGAAIAFSALFAKTRGIHQVNVSSNEDTLEDTLFRIRFASDRLALIYCPLDCNSYPVGLFQSRFGFYSCYDHGHIWDIHDCNGHQLGCVGDMDVGFSPDVESYLQAGYR